ncbi:MAG: endonuclease domain-containing protein [Bacteroidota bacterium]
MRTRNRSHQKQTRQHLRSHGTSAEAVLWVFLQRLQLHGRKFRRQHGIGPYIVDFYCRAESLVIELDGGVHDTPERAAYDAERERHLEAEGLRVLRFRNEAVFADVYAVLDAIAAVFAD